MTSPDHANEPAPASDGPCFVVVTPAFNSEVYLDETILSVVSQVGAFNLIYHVQDGGSTDGTLEILRRWERLLKGGDFPLGCRNLRFSFTSAPDGGMYQAINSGFAAVRPAGRSVMTWINSDDRLAAGALATIEAAYRMFPAVAFTCARISLMDERGSVMGVNLPNVYGRGALARGEHDGRTRNFVMQEGTFWRSDLWDKVGGLDERFRLAGDWDLWRRFAEHADLVTVDTILGFHRRRPGQLTSEMSRYYAEVDAAMAGGRLGSASIEAGETADVIRFDVGLQKLVLFPDYGRTLTVPIVQGQNGIRLQTAKVELLDGARHPEGPLPEVSLPAGIRAIDSTVLKARVSVPFPGSWTMVLNVRSWRRIRIRVLVDGGVCHDAPLGAGRNAADTQVRVGVVLGAGENELSIETSGNVGEPGSLLFFVLDWYVEAPTRREADLLPARRPPALPRRHLHASTCWPRISVVVTTHNHGRFIGHALESLLAQTYPDLEIIVVDRASSDYTRQVVSQYADHIAAVIEDGGAGQDGAVDSGMARATGQILTWLDGQDRLAVGALFSVAHTFLASSDVDLVAGSRLVVDDTGPVRRHVPALPDGPVPSERADVWRTDPFFRKPYVFLSERMWHAAAEQVDASFDGGWMVGLWMRLAAQGAVLHVVGSDLTVCVEEAESALEPVTGPPVPDVAKPADSAGPGFAHVVLFNDHGFRGPEGGAYRGLATALSMAGHRVTALAYADLDAGLPEREMSVDEVVAAIVEHSPDLVVLGHWQSAHTGSADLAKRLTALSLSTIVYTHEAPLVYATSTATEAVPPLTEAGRSRPLDRGQDITATQAGRRAPLAVLTGTAKSRDAIRQATGGTVPVGSIQLGVDTGIFRPRSRNEARRVLDLPQNTFIALTLAADECGGGDAYRKVVGAFQRLESPDKLLLVMGDTPVRPGGGDAIRITEGGHDPDMMALHYAAADVFLGAGPFSALGQAVIEGAAVGTPSVVCKMAGVGEVVEHERTGLLCSASAPASLSHHLQRMHDDPTLRRRLGAAATLRALTRHSLQACAWSFRTTMASLPSFHDGSTVPSIVLAAEEVRPPNVTYLVEGQFPPVNDDAWSAGKGLRRERSGNPALGLAAGYATLVAPTSRAFVKAHLDGVQTLTIKGRNLVEGQRLAVRVNGAAGQDVAMPVGARCTATIRAELIAGPNRVDFDFADSEAGAEADSPTFLLESLSIGVVDPDLSEPAPTWEPLNGFGDLEGPYPESEIESAFRWIVAATARLRIHSDQAGARHLRLVCRIHTIGQLARVSLNGAPAGQVAIEGWRFTDVVQVVLPVQAKRGWNIVTLEMTRLPDPSPDGGEHYMEFYEATLTSSDESSPVGVGVQTFAGEP